MSTRDSDRYEVADRKSLWEGFFRMDRLTVRHRKWDGTWSDTFTREVYERGHAAGLLLWDPATDEVVLTEQFRAPAVEAPDGPWVLEVVAGRREEGESGEETVRREALEEAGVRVDRVERVTEYLTSPGGTSERFALYCAPVDSTRAGGVFGNAHEHEDIRVVVLPLEEALEMVDDGRVCAASTIIALLWLSRHRDRLREAWG